jgi:hypothetical protein
MAANLARHVGFNACLPALRDYNFLRAPCNPPGRRDSGAILEHQVTPENGRLNEQ